VPNCIGLSKQLSNDSLCYVQFRYFYELWSTMNSDSYIVFIFSVSMLLEILIRYKFKSSYIRLKAKQSPLSCVSN